LCCQEEGAPMSGGVVVIGDPACCVFDSALNAGRGQPGESIRLV
jgi:hypothetical protein